MSERKEKVVYVAMAGDLLHAGHINILKHARAYGRVVVGLLSDGAIAQMEEAPFLSYEQRKAVVENLELVDEIIMQESPSYRGNLLALRPDYVVHGDDWRSGYQRVYRQEVLEILHQMHPTACAIEGLDSHPGLIEIPYSCLLYTSDAADDCWSV